MANYFHNLFNAVKQLHYRRGIGDVKEIRIFGDGTITVFAQGFGMLPHTVKGKLQEIGVKKYRIKMYRTSFTVTIID